MPKIGELRAGVPAARTWPRNKQSLYDLGVERVGAFCRLNGLTVPTITVVSNTDWCGLGACAYYRPDTEVEKKWRLKGHGPGINVCLQHCGVPCDDSPGRNWSWPGSVTDREPYGVLCHELGHHVDWLTGVRKGRYYSDYCEAVMKETGEPGLTSYADENPAEWLAESFRLFVTNPYLLAHVRPKTCKAYLDRFKPLPSAGWLEELGANVPAKVVKSLRNKGVG